MSLGPDTQYRRRVVLSAWGQFGPGRQQWNGTGVSGTYRFGAAAKRGNKVDRAGKQWSGAVAVASVGEQKNGWKGIRMVRQQWKGKQLNRGDGMGNAALRWNLADIIGKAWCA